MVLSRAAFVLSRATAAIESLLCLPEWPAEELLLSGWRDDVWVKEGGDWRWVIEGYGWEGVSMCSKAVSIQGLGDAAGSVVVFRVAEGEKDSSDAV